MYEPASDLTELKQLCKAIQGELAYGSTDKYAVAKLAQEVVYFGNRLVAFGGSEMSKDCEMGQMCLGCSPQLIQGICPDSKAGMIVAELVGALQFMVDRFRDTDGSYGVWENEAIEAARSAIAKTGGAE